MLIVTDDELRRLFEDTRQQIDASVAKSGDEIRGYVDESVAKSTAEMRRYFEVHAEDVRTNFDTLAEGVQLLNEKLDRATSDIRDEMRHGRERIDRIESSTH